MRGPVRAVRRKFQLVMAAPADEREHAFTVSAFLPFQHFYRFSIFTVSAFLPFQHFYRFSIETLRLHPSSAPAEY
jgi:hypothetical protein